MITVEADVKMIEKTARVHRNASHKIQWLVITNCPLTSENNSVKLREYLARNADLPMS